MQGFQNLVGVFKNKRPTRSEKELAGYETKNSVQHQKNNAPSVFHLWGILNLKSLLSTFVYYRTLFSVGQFPYSCKCKLGPFC